ncbi:MAG TPA: hypothetical protein PK110_12220 [Niabella sp.]|jgi:hypothetical protein|nr:hypothetical protein [Chitinophagaceae bacterium]HRO85582.1 hypothetical protein [Niabella sp.]HUN01434.1 hypothetical protein [Niabella sp.]
MKGNEISGKELRADSVSKSVENYIRENRIYNHLQVSLNRFLSLPKEPIPINRGKAPIV